MCRSTDEEGWTERVDGRGYAPQPPPQSYDRSCRASRTPCTREQLVERRVVHAQGLRTQPGEQQSQRGSSVRASRVVPCADDAAHSPGLGAAVLGRSPPGQSGAVSATTALAAAAAGPAETRAVAGCVSEPQRGCRTATAPVPEHSGRVTGAVGTYTRRIAPKIGRETALRVPAPAAPPNVSLPPGRGARRWPTMVLQFSLVLGRRSG